MTLDDVPADQTMKLSLELDRLFKAVGCKPGCHACEQRIDIDDEFQLLSFNGTDEMVCLQCGRPELEQRDKRVIESAAKKEREAAAYRRQKIAAGQSGYSRPSTLEEL